ncbi:hypothetical protein GQ56_0113700 [Burkholderia paludis]|nr:hypothetical protein GQ56_0113700 [Burkholderia paludis]
MRRAGTHDALIAAGDPDAPRHAPMPRHAGRLRWKRGAFPGEPPACAIAPDRTARTVARGPWRGWRSGARSPGWPPGYRCG